MALNIAPAARGHLAMLCFSALVAGSFSFGSIVANDLAPAALNAVRFLIALALIGVAAVLSGKLTRSAFQAPWRYLVLGGLLATYFVLMFEGLKTAPPVSTAAVFTLTPAIAGLFGYLLLNQITDRHIALALAIGASGALWVIFRADLERLLQFRVGIGEITYFWGCIAHAIYTPMVRRLNRGEPAVVFTFGTLCAGLLVLTAYGWQDIRATDWSGLSLIVWGTIFYLAIFATATTFVLLQFASLNLPSSKVMAYTYLVPSWVICWEIILGNGAPSGLILIGVALTCLSLLMLLRDEPIETI